MTTETTETIEKELLDLERQYWNAIRTRDVETALQLTDDPCIVTGAQGAGRIDHRSFARMLKDTSWTLHEFEIDKDAQVHLVRDDVAIIAYKVKESLTVEGKEVQLEAADASTWVRQGGRWVCALHTESIVGDPFGRDRKSR
ncbi:MAG: nuclear transport factor 2 family protein [Gemmatimonadota bacterium]